MSLSIHLPAARQVGMPFAHVVQSGLGSSPLTTLNMTKLVYGKDEEELKESCRNGNACIAQSN